MNTDESYIKKMRELYQSYNPGDGFEYAPLMLERLESVLFREKVLLFNIDGLLARIAELQGSLEEYRKRLAVREFVEKNSVSGS